MGKQSIRTLIVLTMFFVLWYMGGRHSRTLIEEKLEELRLAQLEDIQWHRRDVVFLVSEGKKPAPAPAGALVAVKAADVVASHGSIRVEQWARWDGLTLCLSPLLSSSSCSSSSSSSKDEDMFTGARCRGMSESIGDASCVTAIKTVSVMQTRYSRIYSQKRISHNLTLHSIEPFSFPIFFLYPFYTHNPYFQVGLTATTSKYENNWT